MKKLSKMNQALLHAISIGYTLKMNGELFRKNKKVNTFIQKGYYKITVRINNNLPIPLRIHKLQAYQKFGDKIFEEGIMVRHLDGNSLNNSWDNIAIGTNSDNQMDRNPECRLNSSIIATRIMQDGIRSLEERNLIYEDLKNNIPYSQIMLKHGVSSKGTLSFMKNKSIEYQEYLETPQLAHLVRAQD